MYGYQKFVEAFMKNSLLSTSTYFQISVTRALVGLLNLFVYLRVCVSVKIMETFVIHCLVFNFVYNPFLLNFVELNSYL